MKSSEVSRIRNDYIIQTVTFVDHQKIVEKGGRIIRIYEGVIYRENFERTLFRKVIEQLFALKQKYKDEGNTLMQKIVELILSILYGVQIRKDINESCKCEA